MQIDVQVDNACCPEVAEDWLQEVARMALEAESVAANTEVSLVVTGDDTVAQLNQQYRGVEGTTDVLSFSLTEGEEPFVSPPDDVVRLGEVIISYPQAVRQAKEQGHPALVELAHLVVHGVLHLLGYDHEVAAQRVRMRRRERAILARVEASWESRQPPASGEA